MSPPDGAAAPEMPSDGGRRQADPGGFAAVRRTRFADHAYAALFHKIVTGALAEGEKLPAEKDLAALFGISRPVVREALERLRQEGLIASRRGSGSVVQPRATPGVAAADAEEKKRLLLQNLEFRAAIEPHAAALAAERRTEEQLRRIGDAVERYRRVAVEGGETGEHLDFGFHHAVAVASNNRRFVEAVEAVEYDIDHGVNLARYLVRFDHLERSRSVYSDHSRIFAAIRDREPDIACALMRAHLENARRRMVQSRPPLATPMP